MPTLLPQPTNAELLVQDYLRGHADITALVGTRVASDVHETRPCIRVTQITNREVFKSYFDGSLLQFDAYAETQGQARILIDTIRRVVHDIAGVHARGTATGVEHERGPDWAPDPFRTNAQGKPLPAYSVDYRVYVTPNT